MSGLGGTGSSGHVNTDELIAQYTNSVNGLTGLIF